VLAHRKNQRGLTLVELLMAVAIVAILLMVGVPALGGWVKNAQVRTTANAIQDGLQLARAEAVRMNKLVRFQLTSTIDDSCAASASSSNWVVSLYDPTGACATPTTATFVCVGADPCIAQVHSAGEGGGGTVNASQSLVCFNGLGQQSSSCGTPTAVTIRVTNSSGGACMPAGNIKCMNVQVSTAGQIHMCDAALTYSATTPTGC
jgi:type IV fimbrial biogenesis protein FimT